MWHKFAISQVCVRFIKKLFTQKFKLAFFSIQTLTKAWYYAGNSKASVKATSTSHAKRDDAYYRQSPSLPLLKTLFVLLA